MIGSELAVVPQVKIPTLAGIDQLVKKFLESQDVRASSRATYKKMILIFLVWMKAEDVNQPDRDTILKYKDTLVKRGLSNLTISGYLVAVRQFFKWAEGMKYYPNIAAGVKGAKRNKGFRKDSLTGEMCRHLLASIDRSEIYGLRDYAMLTLMITTGLRTIEVSKCDVGDIRTNQGAMVLYVQGKGRDSKDDFVVLPDFTCNAIRAYLKERGAKAGDEAMWTSLSDRNPGTRLAIRTISAIVKNHLVAAGFNSKMITAHSLRHTAVTLAMEAGSTLQEASAMARHSSIATTQIYAHNINRVKTAPEYKIANILTK
jgi:integrase/recombinase XerD